MVDESNATENVSSLSSIENANIDKDVSVGPYSIIGRDVSIESGTVIGPHVVIKGPTLIGPNNKIFQFF